MPNRSGAKYSHKAPRSCWNASRPWVEREFEITREAALKSIRSERQAIRGDVRRIASRAVLTKRSRIPQLKAEMFRSRSRFSGTV